MLCKVIGSAQNQLFVKLQLRKVSSEHLTRRLTEVIMPEQCAPVRVPTRDVSVSQAQVYNQLIQDDPRKVNEEPLDLSQAVGMLIIQQLTLPKNPHPISEAESERDGRKVEAGTSAAVSAGRRRRTCGRPPTRSGPRRLCRLRLVCETGLRVAAMSIRRAGHIAILCRFASLLVSVCDRITPLVRLRQEDSLHNA